MNDGYVTLLQGDALETLRTLPDGAAQMCVTSPPYWGLRDYGTATWEGGDVACGHFKLLGGVDAQGLGKSDAAMAANVERSSVPYRDTCGKCGARRIDSQLGLEKSPEEFVARMVAVFAEVRRVLRDDGTLWLNIGDSYAGAPVGTFNGGGFKDSSAQSGGRDLSGIANGSRQSKVVAGLKPKDLVGIPWLLAFALRADGWYLRSDIIWSKPNPMPESVTDRPTKAHEYLFLLSKRERYHYDAGAIREPYEMSSWTAVADRDGGTARFSDGIRSGAKGAARAEGAADGSHYGATSMMGAYANGGRNKRSVWTIATEPYPEAHFATFPTALVKPCILAGCPEGGTVLDPFAGSGTTLQVAKELGRKSIGIELNPEYIALIEKRIARITTPFAWRSR